MNPKQISRLSFRNKSIRKIFVDGEWFFSVIDVAGGLADSADSAAYRRKLKQRLIAEGSQVVTICHGLKLKVPNQNLRDHMTERMCQNGLTHPEISFQQSRAKTFEIGSQNNTDNILIKFGFLRKNTCNLIFFRETTYKRK